MSGIAKKTDEELWKKVKTDVTKSDHGGQPGQWSARKAQMATSEYKAKGGGYEGDKPGDNHLQQWTDEKWGTASGKESLKTGERYLPEKARKALSPAEYKRTSAKKREDLDKGRQFSAQPKDVAKKTAAHRSGKTDTRAALYEQAKARDIPGRSRMSRAELAHALGTH